VNSKQRKTLAKVFREPASPTIKWQDIENLLEACGAKISEGRGSRVRAFLHGVAAVFHRPHPRPTADKGTVAAVRDFLEQAGVTPDEG
jgi:hypothetical protein